MCLIINADKTDLSNKIVKDLTRHHQIREIPVTIGTFADGEVYVRDLDCVRGEDVYILHSLCRPVNDSAMRILILADALHRSSAKSVNLVAPYLGYSRQDRKVGPRDPISAKVIANLFEHGFIDRILTVDIHTTQICGFYNIPVESIPGAPVFANYIKSNMNLDNVAIVSPDHGGVIRARKFADMLGISNLAIIDKQRLKPNEVAEMKLIGNVTDKDCLIIDDLIDTGGTLKKAVNLLKENEAKSVKCFCTHPVLSRNGEGLDIDVFVLNTIPVKDDSNCKIIDLADYLAGAIYTIENNDSLSDFINNYRG